MQDHSTNGRSRGEALAGVSTGLVQLYARRYGKGPTRAKTTQIANDTIVCVMRDPYTVAELTLLGGGEGEVVRRMRDEFQHAVEADARGIAEENLGRRVIARIAMMHADPDIAVEIFQLEPFAHDSWLFDVAGPAA